MAGGGQPSVAVVEQGPGDLGQVQIQERQHEQLVPEDMPAVRLSVQAPRRHPDIQLGGVLREGLEEVEEVQTQNPAGLSGDLQLGLPPQVLPGAAVRRAQLPEVRGQHHGVHGRVQRTVDRRVAGGVQRHRLVDDRGGVGADGHPQGLGGL